MNIWKKKSREKEEVPIDGQTFQFSKGDLNLGYIHYWQENPRLEGKAKDFEDNDEGTVNEKIFDLMLDPDKIRKLANQIDKDGGLRMPIWVGEDEEGKYVVYDGNRRYSAILHLQKVTRKPKYNTIKAVLMEAPGLTFVQKLAISTAFNTDGVKEWSPYARAEMLTNLYDNKMQEGSDEKGALKFAQSAMTGAGGVAQIKAMIDSHRLINKYKLSNDRFSIVNEGYVKAGILVINHINGTSQLRREKATGKKGPATALELGTYALSRSFSHASHGDRPRSFVPHRPMYRSQVRRYPATLKTCASRLVLCAM